MKIYVDHGAVVVFRLPDQSTSVEELSLLVRRLVAVTKGCECREMTLTKPPGSQLDFHIQHEGVVVDVQMYSKCWQAGLRQGSRIVEVRTRIFRTRLFLRMRRFTKTVSVGENASIQWCRHNVLRFQINGVSLATLTLDQLHTLLSSSTTLRSLVIPPSADGSPRRGCEDAHCSAAKGVLDPTDDIQHIQQDVYQQVVDVSPLPPIPQRPAQPPR